MEEWGEGLHSAPPFLLIPFFPLKMFLGRLGLCHTVSLCSTGWTEIHSSQITGMNHSFNRGWGVSGIKTRGFLGPWISKLATSIFACEVLQATTNLSLNGVTGGRVGHAPVMVPNCFQWEMRPVSIPTVPPVLGVTRLKTSHCGIYLFWGISSKLYHFPGDLLWLLVPT